MASIKVDSKEVKKGDIFLSLKSINNNEKKYIEEAINNGASKIICEEGNYNVETVITADSRKYLNKYLYGKYYDKIKDIKLIGITGTSGKTTTAFLTYQLLKKLNQKVAYIGTIGFWIDKKVKDLNNTTPDIYDIYELLLECKKKKVKFVIMEISSHALKLGRIETLFFDEACFTNISKEHMDFHRNMRNYFNAKKTLFYKLRNQKVAVINENKYSKKLLKLNNKNILVKNKNIKNVKLYMDRSEFDYEIDSKIYHFNINLVGYYNILNYLDAVLLVYNLGFDINKILNINVYSPKGRMELINYKNNFIFIDYAHKPDAVLKVLELVNDIKENKVYVIIGCGGDRDKTKRHVMGEISVKNSDYVIFTSDNPRNENPKDILKDITKNLKRKNYEIIENRNEAIKKGIKMLNEKDILLILGKGHEEYQIINNKKYDFSDIEIVGKIIKKKK